MDPQIEELKELVRENIAIAKDNNKMLHGLRRGAWMSRLMRVLWIVLIVGASLYSYVYFQPYIDQILGLYNNIQELQQKAGSFIPQ